MSSPVRYFTQDEDAIILRMKAAHHTYREIAAEIGNGRTREDIANRVNKLKLGAKPKPTETQEQRDRELVDRAFVFRARGFSCAQSAQAMNITEGILRGALRRLRVVWNPERSTTPMITHEVVVEARKRRKEGQTIPAIAEALGVPEQALKTQLHHFKEREAVKLEGFFGISSAAVEPWVKNPPAKKLPERSVKMALCEAFAKGRISRQQLSDGLRGYPVSLPAGV